MKLKFTVVSSLLLVSAKGFKVFATCPEDMEAMLLCATSYICLCANRTQSASVLPFLVLEFERAKRKTTKL